MKTTSVTTAERAQNSPSLVRDHFLTYLKSAFPYKQDWKHPVTETKFSHGLVEEKLKQLRRIDPIGYQSLWFLWSSQGTRCFVADRLHVSGPTIKRRWNKSLDVLMLMMLFSDLVPEKFSLNDFDINEDDD